MALVEVLTLKVGAVIAKTILKLWLRDENTGKDLGTDIIDILRERTSDVIAQRNGARQIEAIGDSVALSLLPLFEYEGRGIDDGGKSSIAKAVAETIEQVNLDANFLVQINLEPIVLSRILNEASSDIIKYFSENEIALFQRIIQEASRMIVDIASQLPMFSERTFAEILKREERLINIAIQILEEVRKVQNNSAHLGQDIARFETEYRLSVARSLDKLELFGLDLSTASRRHRLSVAYVTLNVRRGFREFPEKHKNVAQEIEHQFSSIMSVDEALSQSKKLFVSGMAGSGKTTLLQWIAVRSALQDFPLNLIEWVGTIPFLIRLRQFGDTILPSPESFPKHLAPAISGLIPQGWVHSQLNSGNAIVLIDGVDELSEKRRQEAYSWLEEIVMTFPNARYLVTSRPHAVSDEWLTQLGFDFAELQPMDILSISEFINHWHQSVRGELRDEEEKIELENLPEKLKATLRQNSSIRNLATNPLLCAMLCALHRDRNQQLPSDRLELYEAACYMLLERRDIERHIKLRDYPKLTYRQKRNILQDLAYWMLINGWTEVTKQRAIDRLSRRVAHLEGIQQGVEGSNVYQFCVERSGLIREPSVGQMDFAHRTFQEFLAAHAVLEEDNIGVLIRNAHDDQWREVIILAAGLARPKERDELVEGLITRGYKDKQYRYRLHLLAMACLETSIELSPETKTKAEKHVIRLVPPKDFDEAKALASAGELALPYLEIEKNPALGEGEAAACVRTLMLIGGDSALSIIEGYKNDNRESVVIELLRGKDFFPTEDYFNKILKQISILRLQQISTLEGVEFLKNLSILDLSESFVRDLTPLNELQLIKLDLSKCGYLWNLNPLSNITSLKWLSLSDCFGIEDISAIGELTNLTELNIKNCSKIEDIRPLHKLSHLIKLDIRNCDRIFDLTPILHFRQLRSVKFDGVSPQALKKIPREILEKWKRNSVEP